MTTSTAPTTPTLTPSIVQPRVLFGMACGLLAALCYGSSNVCQRFIAAERADVSWAIFVCMFKLLPLLMMGIAGMLWAKSQGRPIKTTRRIMITMFFAGLVMQWPGNILIQLGMSYCGLAVSVPLCFAFILISGSLFGKWILGEGISKRSILSQGVLVIATGLLAIGAPQAVDSVAGTTSTASIAFGITVTIISGIAFGYVAVPMREAVKDNGSVSASMAMMAAAGVLSCAVVSCFTMTPQALADISSISWSAILGQGVLTGVAYIFISLAFANLSVIQANVVNASQIALAALGGVLVFHEPATIWLQLGTVLNILGLVSMDHKAPEEATPAELNAVEAIEAWPNHPESALVHQTVEVA